MKNSNRNIHLFSLRLILQFFLNNSIVLRFIIRGLATDGILLVGLVLLLVLLGLCAYNSLMKFDGTEKRITD
jgi:hypothetical protein